MMNNSLSGPYNILVDACLLPPSSLFSFPMEIIVSTFHNSSRFMKVGNSQEIQVIFNLLTEPNIQR